MAKKRVFLNSSVRDAIETYTHAMRAQVTVLRAEDPDGIHDMRVASRRLRAVLSANATMFRKPVVGKFQGRIRQVTSVLGKARELDVTLGILERDRKDFHGPARYAVNRVARDVCAQRAAQSAAIEQGVALVAASGFDEELSTLFEHLRDEKGYRKRAIRNTTKRYEKLVESYAEWRRKRTEEALHRLRIAFKKFRYTCEMYRELYGPQMKALVSRLKDAQEFLGDWHDYCILRSYVEQAIPSAPPRAAQGMPALRGFVDSRIEMLLEQFNARAKKFFKKSTREETVAFLRKPPRHGSRKRPAKK